MWMPSLWLFYFFSICTFTIQYIKLCASAGMSLSSVSGAQNIILDSLSSFILVFDRKKAGGLLNKWWKKMFNLVHSRIILYFQWFIFYPPWAFSKYWGGLTLTGERMWPRRHFDTSNIQNFSHSYGVNVKAKTKLEKVSGQIQFSFSMFSVLCLMGCERIYNLPNLGPTKMEIEISPLLHFSSQCI